MLGFTGDANALLVRDLGSQQLMSYAEQVARWAVSHHRPDAGAVQPDDGGLPPQFIKQFGLRAFRQPLTDDPAARYEKLFAGAATFEAGLELTISAMLQSPYFLYRRELGEPDPAKAGHGPPDLLRGGQQHLVPHPRSMPDEALLRLPPPTSCSTRAQIDAQVERLLQDPKNRATVNTFMGEWLETKRVEGVLKDPNIFNFPDALRADMERETAALIEDVVFTRKGTLTDLFTADYTFVNASLAKHYGIAGVTGTDLVKVPAPHDTGILAQGSLMAGHAGMTFSSPTLRGKLVRTRFLCEDLPPPPSNVNTNIMPPKEARTTREIFQAHVDNPACGGCHTVMDRIGFGFENYDVAGRYRTKENGVPVDASGAIDGPATSTFKGLGELNDYLSTNDDVRQCMVRFMSYFAYGATGWTDDGCTIDAINDEAKESNWSIRSVLTAITHAAPLHDPGSIGGRRETQPSNLHQERGRRPHPGAVLQPAQPRHASAAGGGPRARPDLPQPALRHEAVEPEERSGESSFTLPEMFSKPWSPLLPNLVMVDGLAPMRPGDNHFSPHALTGVGREGRADKGIISIEQYIGDQLEKTPDKRPIKNLILGAERRLRVGLLPEQRPPHDHRLADVGLQHRLRELRGRRGRLAERAARAAQEHPRRHQAATSASSRARSARARSRSSSYTSTRSASSRPRIADNTKKARPPARSRRRRPTTSARWPRRPSPTWRTWI